MAGFNSFKFLLLKYLAKLNPKMILEWGPGESTRIMMDSCPEANIYTIENDKGYHKIYTIRFSAHSNVFVKYAEAPKYWEMPLGWNKKFDLIFVDGFCDYRVNCLKTASQLVTDEGVVLLHDSERAKYDEGVALFEKIEEVDGTLALKKKSPE